MPQRFIRYSKTEPARTILFLVSALTFIMQAAFVLLHFTPFAVPNLIVVGVISAWGLWAGYTNKPRQMSLSSFWLFMIWLWSAIARVLVSPDPAQLLWMPMLTVAMCLAVVYLYLSNQRRTGKDE